MPSTLYFNRPTTNAYHDLTSYIKPPMNLRALLGLNTKFIPKPRQNTAWEQIENETLPRFERAMRLKAFFAYKHNGTDLVKTWNDLDNEGKAVIKPDEHFNPKLHVPSDWEPPPECPFPPPLERRLHRFKEELRKCIRPRRHKTSTNLWKHQRRALYQLKHHPDLVMIKADKNLGPCVIERDRYIKMVIRDHLSDKRTYQRLREEDIPNMKRTIFKTFDTWMRTFHKVIDHKKFLQDAREKRTEVFSTFYALPKVHKETLSTRPIVSTSGTLLQAVGLWCDDKLQPIAKETKAYIRDSFDFRQQLEGLTLPPGAKLFTSDATAMYTKIPTNKAIRRIGKYIKTHAYQGAKKRCLMAALKMVMKLNVFKFGDTYWQQKTGTAMGTPPAPPWAQLYFGTYEEEFLPEFDCILFYKRYIDDIFGVYIPGTTTFEDFKDHLNDCGSELTWKTTDLSDEVIFLDMIVKIQNNKLVTTLYEKPNNHHLYIPPSSCHPPGLLTGMIHGSINRIFQLCSEQSDRHFRTNEFLRHLQRRGYAFDQLKPIFLKAINNALTSKSELQPLNKALKMHRSLLFHIPYHPDNPKSSTIQRIWTNTICQPPIPAKPLWKHRNYRFKKIEIDKLIIAYNRPPNMGNILSNRNLKDTGPPASSFMD